jgi:hypothetical protein
MFLPAPHLVHDLSSNGHRTNQWERAMSWGIDVDQTPHNCMQVMWGKQDFSHELTMASYGLFALIRSRPLVDQSKPLTSDQFTFHNTSLTLHV